MTWCSRSVLVPDRSRLRSEQLARATAPQWTSTPWANGGETCRRMTTSNPACVSHVCEAARDLCPNRLPTVTLVGRTTSSLMQCVTARGMGSDLAPIERHTPRRITGQIDRGRAGEAMLARRTANIPVRKMPSNVPAPPMDATGAPRPFILFRLSRSAPISVPNEPQI